MKKLGSMQLSINAIVILVMAMAVLGIGLGLIRGVLAPAQTNLEDAIGKVDLSEAATSSKPIADVPETIRLKNDDENQIALSFYNAGKDSCDSVAGGASFKFDCGSSVSFSQTTPYLYVPVTSGTSSALIGTIEPTTSTTGSIPCKLQVVCEDGTATHPQASTKIVESRAVFIDFSS